MPRPLLALLGLAVAGAGACSSNHDALALRPDASGGNGGGVIDASADGDASGGTGGTGGASGAGGEAGAAGPWRLTLVHGVVDAPRIWFCFARADDGGAISGAPLPDGGLAYGASLALDQLPGIDPASDAVEPYVVAADAPLVAGKDCATLVAEAAATGAGAAGADASTDASADAGGDATADGASDAAADAASDAAQEAAPPEPPTLRASSLPVLPAGTLGADASYLLVASGCLGGPGLDDALGEAVCGTGYTGATPTLAPVLVRMSRQTAPKVLALQVVHASAGTAAVDVQSAPPDGSGAKPVTIATNVVPGSIAPRPAKMDAAVVDLGAPTGDARLQVLVPNAGAVELDQKWSEALARGAISGLADGHAYAAILLGPRPDVAAQKWWNAPAFSVVEP